MASAEENRPLETEKENETRKDGAEATVENGPSHEAAAEFKDTKSSENLEFILDIPLEVSVELGRTKLLINELLKLGQGSVIELSKLAGETLEILANQKLIARGEVVVVNEKYGVRLTEVISPMERIERLR
jgi:flagellar motor switch protein FliN/FliY